MKQFETLHLTDFAIQFLYNEAAPIVAHDFIGYITKYSTHSNVGIGVTISGDILVFSMTSKPLSARKITRILNKLIKKQFLEISIEPFPEFSEKFNLQFDLSKAFILDGPYFRRAS